LRYALERGVFGITVLDVAALELVKRFAGPALDRFAGLRWTFSPLGTPWIEQSMTAAADCEVWRSTELGDHTLLWGTLRNLRVPGSGDPVPDRRLPNRCGTARTDCEPAIGGSKD
jgi:flavin reductase (DIM6/NTAB) family NADH-FMN oxidoreductase RutF